MEQKGWVDSHRLRRLFFAWCERENLVISPKGWSPDIEVQKGHVHIYSEDDVIPSNKPEQCRGFRCLQTLEDVYKHTGIHPARMEEQEIHEYIPSRMEWLKDNAQVLPVPGQEYHYIFVPRTDPPMDNPRLSLNQFRNDIRNETGKEIAVFITPDPRGPGYALFRNEDHPGVEFGRLKSSSCAVIQAETSFVHTGGFYATTPSLEPKILVRLVSAACDKPA
jgi:hypothetical protein